MSTTRTSAENDAADVQEEEAEEEEDWSQYLTSDASAGSFAQHELQIVSLPPSSRNSTIQKSIQIASTKSLTPLDMMDLSWGTCDATGHKVWLGAQFFLHAMPLLEDYLEQQSSSEPPSSTTTRRCLELGSGTGLAGIAMTRFYDWEPSNVVLTDNSESALALCRHNCKVNELQDIAVHHLAWGVRQFESFQRKLGTGSTTSLCFDLVIATDVLYDIDAWKPLLETAYLALQGSSRGKERPKYLILSHVARAALPDNLDTPSRTSEHVKISPFLAIPPRTYPQKLETYLVETAANMTRTPFRLTFVVRPEDVPTFSRQSEMTQCGASILIFQPLPAVQTVLK